MSSALSRSSVERAGASHRGCPARDRSGPQRGGAGAGSESTRSHVLLASGPVRAPIGQPLPSWTCRSIGARFARPSRGRTVCGSGTGSTAEGVRAGCRPATAVRGAISRAVGRGRLGARGAPRVPYLRGVLVLGRDELLSAEAFVAPDMRARNVHPASVAYKLRRLQDAGTAGCSH